MKQTSKNNPFILRRLELAPRIVKEMEKGDLSAFVNLAAMILADDESLKLYASGNNEILKPFADGACVMDVEEVAAMLAGFTSASKRFSLILSGLSPE